MTQQRQLKKRLRELKRIRTAVITGEDTRYTIEQVNKVIENVRIKLGTAEDREVIVKYDLFEWQYLTGLGYTFDKYKKMLGDGVTHYNIAREWGVTPSILKEHMDKEEEKEMARVAKITVEQYKEYAGQGLKMKEIAERVGLSDASVYAYKQKWKNEGLLDDGVTEKVSVVKSDELDRLTKINADLASEHELLKEENSKLTENNRLLTNKINELVKKGEDDRIVKFNITSSVVEKLEQQLHDAKAAYEHANVKNTELNEQMDDLEAQNNVLKERYEDLQGIASGYENHEKELHEEIAYLKEELTAERDKHNNDSDLQQRYDHLATFAKPVLKSFVESL